MAEYSKKFNISIIGCGFLGGALASGFSNYSNIKIYDKYKEFDTFEETVAHGDIFFFCLPTPFYKDDNGRQDLSILHEAIGQVNDAVDPMDDKVAVIKSTVLPGTNRAFQEKYKNLTFVSNPEFLSAASARLDFLTASRNVLGGPKEAVDKVDALYKHRFGDSLLTFKVEWEEAELVKYTNNIFFALKLTYLNYIYDICQKLEIDYDKVKDMFSADGRVGRSHDSVNPDHKRGWGNFCFPKDLLALINYVQDELGMDPKLLQDVWDLNLEQRGEADWEQLGPSVMSFKNARK